MAPRTGDKGAGDADAPPFTIVVPFRDTPRERKFAERSIPSAIALGPDELVVGIDGAGEGTGGDGDGDGDDALAAFISALCERHGHAGRLSVVRAARSPEWRFQLANVIWHCYRASRNDVALSFDKTLCCAARSCAGPAWSAGTAWQPPPSSPSAC